MKKIFATPCKIAQLELKGHPREGCRCKLIVKQSDQVIATVSAILEPAMEIERLQISMKNTVEALSMRTTRLEAIVADDVTNISVGDLETLVPKLTEEINNWLNNSLGFQPVINCLRENMMNSQSSILQIQCDLELTSIPFEEWELAEELDLVVVFS